MPVPARDKRESRNEERGTRRLRNDEQRNLAGAANDDRSLEGSDAGRLAESRLPGLIVHPLDAIEIKSRLCADPPKAAKRSRPEESLDAARENAIVRGTLDATTYRV